MEENAFLKFLLSWDKGLRTGGVPTGQPGKSSEANSVNEFGLPVFPELLEELVAPLLKTHLVAGTRFSEPQHSSVRQC